MFEVRLSRWALPLQLEMETEWVICHPVRVVTFSFLCFHWTIFIV